MRAFVIGAADDFCTRWLEKKKGDLLITADAGYAKIADKSLIDVAIGDFDSLGYVPDISNVIKLKREKDETDTDVAAEYAAKKGADEIYFYGCLGGKPDHAVANLQLGARIADRGIKTLFVSNGYTVYFVKGDKLELPARKKGRVSVFSPDVTEGVTIRGLKYEIEGRCLTNRVALGVSNEFIGKKAEISAEKGLLTVYVYEEDNNIRP